MEIKIRPATAQDRAHTLRLYEEFFRLQSLPADAQEIQSFFDRWVEGTTLGRGELFMVEADKKVVGIFYLVPHLSVEYGGPALVLDNIILDEPYRDHGIGSAVMRFVEDYARRSGCRVMTLQTVEDIDPRVTNFFNKHGFELRANKLLVKTLE